MSDSTVIGTMWKFECRETCLSAQKYAEKLQWKFQLSSGGKRVYTPLPPSEPGGMKPVTAMNKFEYLFRTGSLLYASTCCRRDLQHGVSTAAQANKQRHQLHCFKLERVMRYFLQTKGKHLYYGSKGSDLFLRAYCDASFGPTSKADTNQRSSYRWVFTLGGFSISWCAKHFDSPSLNVCEAEMMAIKETTTQVIHLQALISKLGVQQPRLALIGEGSSVRALGQQVLVSVLEGS